jgi:Tol biopolymer transport system component
LVFDPSLNQRLRPQFRWVDRRGQTIKSLDVPTGFLSHWLSPNEKRFIADRFDPQTGTYDLWMYEISGSNPKRFTSNQAANRNPVWSPDGSRIVWSSTRDGVQNLYQKAASFDGDDTPLLKSDYRKFPTDWSWDGRFIIYHQLDPKTNWDVWVLPMTGSDKEKPFRALGSKANETAGTLSPDGRWLAYASDESGRYEVWVQSFPGGGGKRQVSNGGGGGPRWQRDGRELFYYSGDGKLMSAQVRRGESFETSSPVPLFEFRAGVVPTRYAPYAVSRDGQRFLINEVVDLEPNAPLTVVVNWAAELKK